MVSGKVPMKINLLGRRVPWRPPSAANITSMYAKSPSTAAKIEPGRERLVAFARRTRPGP